MRFLLLHHAERAEEFRLLKEGPAATIQAFLTAHECQEASHYRIFRGDEQVIQDIHNVTIITNGLERLVFYTSRPPERQRKTTKLNKEVPQ